jgi:hypothetical protein
VGTADETGHFNEVFFAEAISTYMGKIFETGDCFVAQNAPRKDISRCCESQASLTMAFSK